MSVSPPRDTCLVINPDSLLMPLISRGGIDLLRVPRPLTTHTHAEFEVTYLLEGEVTWRLIGGPSLRLTGGALAVIQPGVSHFGEYEIIQPCRLLWFLINPLAPQADRYTPFTTDDLRHIHQQLATAGNMVTQADREMTTLFRSFEACLRAQQSAREMPLYASRLRAVLSQLVLQSVQALYRQLSSRESDVIARAKAYIASHLDCPLRVEETARYVGLCPSRFYERFKQEVGQTPADYCNRLRCAEARTLLARTDTPVTEIAFTLGFATSQYFASCFRKYTGMSPTEYRHKRK